VSETEIELHHVEEIEQLPLTAEEGTGYRAGQAERVGRTVLRVLTSRVVSWSVSSVLLGVTTLALLWRAAPVDWRAFAGSVAADMAAAGVFALLLSPLILLVRRFLMQLVGRRVSERYEAFPYEAFRRWLRSSGDVLRIMDTSSRVLDPASAPGPRVRELRESCVAELISALQRGNRVEILLLDPASLATGERQDELDSLEERVDLARDIQANLRLMNQIYHEQLPAEYRSNLQVRLFNTSPGLAFYRVDQQTLIAFYVRDRLSDESPHLDFPLRSPYGRGVNDYFRRVWATGLPFLDFLYCAVTVAGGPPERTFPRVAFLDTQQGVVLALGYDPAIAELSDTSKAFRLAIANTSKQYTVTTTSCVARDDPRATAWRSAFEAKYGIDFDFYFPTQTASEPI
jgi:hypothetical protein